MSTKRKNALDGLWDVLDRVRESQSIEEKPSDQPAEPAPPAGTYLIAGLGNPDKEYLNNRHNAGFMVVDRLAERLGLHFSRMQHQALVTDGRYKNQKIILAKPQTYMNNSGQPIAALLKFYKVPIENLMVIFDEMDIPLGALRIRPKGGSGGHQGMNSIISRLGNRKGFPRMRIGIGRPPGRMPPPAYLLQDFTYDQQTALQPILDDAVDALLAYITEGLSTAMNRYNQSAEESRSE